MFPLRGVIINSISSHFHTCPGLVIVCCGTSLGLPPAQRLTLQAPLVVPKWISPTVTGIHAISL